MVLPTRPRASSTPSASPAKASTRPPSRRTSAIPTTRSTSRRSPSARERCRPRSPPRASSCSCIPAARSIRSGRPPSRPDDLDLIAHGPRDARWVLFEVPFAGIDAEWLAACRHIREAGFSLLIAHPERAEGFLTGGHELLRPELAAGALLQVNVCSLLGRHGPEAREGAVRLVRDGDAYVLASDGHGSPNRAHTLAAGPAAALAAGVSPLRSRAAHPRQPALPPARRHPARATPGIDRVEGHRSLVG